MPTENTPIATASAERIIAAKLRHGPTFESDKDENENHSQEQEK